MNEIEFHAHLANEGCEGPFDFAMTANLESKQHAHAYGVFALVVEGSITIEKPAGAVTCRVGETVRFAANEPHVEKAGPDGVKLKVGRRTSAA